MSGHVIFRAVFLPGLVIGAGLLLLETPCSECETLYAACLTAAYYDDL